MKNPNFKILNKTAGSSRYYDVICLHCNSFCVKRSDHINNNIIKSCGCKKNRGLRFKGYFDISGTLFLSYKKGAIERGIDFNITIEDIWDRYIEQSRLCMYTKQLLYFDLHNQGKSGGFRTASVDRIDSNIGYIKNNIQIVHILINKMKLDFSSQELIKWTELCTKYNLVIS